jgi:hypothetical protein
MLVKTCFALAKVVQTVSVPVLLPVRNMQNGERNMAQKRSGYKIISIASLLLITSHSCAIQNLTENANSILIVKFREDVRRE